MSLQRNMLRHADTLLCHQGQGPEGFCAHLYHRVMTLFVSLPFWSLCQLRARPKSAILRQPSLQPHKGHSTSQHSATSVLAMLNSG